MSLSAHDSAIPVLITGLSEGGNNAGMLKRAGELTGAGVQIITLLALSDDGAPGYNHQNASAMASLGAPRVGMYAGALSRPDGCHHQPPGYLPMAADRNIVNSRSSEQ